MRFVHWSRGVSLALASCVVAVCVPSAVLAANAFEQFGFGPRAMAMAGSLTADARDYSAVFYNPAMLVRQRELNFGFGLTYGQFTPDVQANPAEANSRTLDCSACQPPNVFGINAGFTFPLAGKVKNRVAIGLGVYLPSTKVLRVRASDPQRLAWYRYDSGPEGVGIHLATGIRVTDSVSLGLGMQILANLLGQGMDLKVDLFSNQVESRSIDSHLGARYAPTVGLHVSPVSELRLGATYRGEISVRYAIPANIDLEGIGKLGLVVSGVTHYSPHTFHLGAAWDVSSDLTFTIDGEYALWSRAPSPYIDVEVDLSGSTIDGLGLDEALDLAAPAPPPGFKDTVGGSLGIEQRVGERFAIRGGAFYRPTPVPLQDAPGTNILDADMAGFGVGASVGFDDPLEVFSKMIKLELATQLAFALPREANKELTDDVPPYSYGARVFAFSLSLGYVF